MTDHREITVHAYTTTFRHAAVVTIVVVLLLGFTATSPSAAEPNPDRPGRGHSVESETVLVQRTSAGLQAQGHAPAWVAVPVRRGESPEQAVERLNLTPGIEAASLNYRYELFAPSPPNDPYFPDQWHLSDVGVPDAWESGEGSGITLAVIDGGVSAGGEDLACHAFRYPFDATTGAPSAEPEPTNPRGSHGTHVAGTALQCSDNGIRTAGMAPGVDLLPVKVSDTSDNITSEYLADGIIWAVDHGADVINMSLGRECTTDWPECGEYDWALNDAIDYAASKDIVIVGASGNFSRNYVSYPANHPAVIAVGATTVDHSRAGYSNYGSGLDLVAPGGGNVTVDGILQESFDDSTGVWGVYAKVGTSFASPLVAGTAALMLAVNPDLSSSTIREILKSTTLDLGLTGWDPIFGAGLVQADAAVTAASLAPTTGDATIAGGPLAVSAAVAGRVAAITGASPERIAGANRYATAAALSAAAHNPGIPLVYVTIGTNYPDAISLGSVAALRSAPVLLVNTAIPAETRDELVRLSPNRIVVIGGPAAVSDGVVAQLGAYSAEPVERVFGHDRYATSAQVSRSFFAAGAANEVFVASGQSSWDALAAGSAAAASPGPVLLTRSTDLPSTVRDEIARLNPSRVVIVGGLNAVSAAVEQTILSLGFAVERVAGVDRYDTSSRLSRRAFPTTPLPLLIATGENYPDGLTATSYIGARGGSLLLTRTTDLPAVIAAEVARLSGR